MKIGKSANRDLFFIQTNLNADGIAGLILEFYKSYSRWYVSFFVLLYIFPIIIVLNKTTL